MAAYEEHLAAVLARRGDEDAAVDDAFDALADAFDRYEAVLDVELGETLPMLLDDGDGDDEDDDEDDDQADDEDEDDDDDEGDDDALDPHAEEDEDELDDDLDDFRLN